MPKPRIFISYARGSVASFEQIAALRPALTNAGFDTLQDVEIELGEDWESKLERWLADCHGAVVFVSPEALSSDWVAREVKILIGRREAAEPQRMRIVPIAVGGLDWNDLRKDSTDHRFGPLSSIQGGTDLETDQIVFQNVERPIATLTDHLMRQSLAPPGDRRRVRLSDRAVHECRQYPPVPTIESDQRHAIHRASLHHR